MRPCVRRSSGSGTALKERKHFSSAFFDWTGSAGRDLGSKTQDTKKRVSFVRGFVRDFVRGRATIFLVGWIWRNARWEGAGGEGGISGAVWSRATRDGGWMDRGAGVLSCEIYYPARPRARRRSGRSRRCMRVCMRMCTCTVLQPKYMVNTTCDVRRATCEDGRADRESGRCAAVPPAGAAA